MFYYIIGLFWATWRLTKRECFCWSKVIITVSIVWVCTEIFRADHNYWQSDIISCFIWKCAGLVSVIVWQNCTIKMWHFPNWPAGVLWRFQIVSKPRYYCGTNGLNFSVFYEASFGPSLLTWFLEQKGNESRAPITHEQEQNLLHCLTHRNARLQGNNRNQTYWSEMVFLVLKWTAALFSLGMAALQWLYTQQPFGGTCSLLCSSCTCAEVVIITCMCTRRF